MGLHPATTKPSIKKYISMGQKWTTEKVLTHMVLSAADRLGGALSTAANTDDGDGNARDTDLSGDGVDGNADQAGEPVALLTAGIEELITYEKGVSRSKTDITRVRRDLQH